MTPEEFAKLDTKRRKRSKRAEALLLVPLIGVLLFVSPFMDQMALSFASETTLSRLIYIFGAWGMLILACFILSSLLQRMR